MRTRMWTAKAVATGAALALTLALAACGGEGDPGVQPKPGPALVLDFDSGPEVGEELTSVSNQGSGDIDVAVESLGGGKVEVVKGPAGGQAVRFPAFAAAAPAVPEAPVAVLVATASQSDADESERLLSPGDYDFSFGATFMIDSTSAGIETDNGDNLVQRGSFEGPGQFKLQLDGHRPNCRILGDEGEVIVQGDTTVTPGEWYSVTCTRTGSTVQLRLARHGTKGQDQIWSTSGDTGSLTLDGEPLSVGGKVHPDGSPRTSADQFNGAVDDVFVDIK